MLDTDRQLLLLREIETRISFVEHYVARQDALVQRLAAQGLANDAEGDLLHQMTESLSTLELTRRDLLHDMLLVPSGDKGAPPAPHAES